MVVLDVPGSDAERGAGASELPSVPTRRRRLYLNRCSALGILRSDQVKPIKRPSGVPATAQGDGQKSDADYAESVGLTRLQQLREVLALERSLEGGARVAPARSTFLLPGAERRAGLTMAPTQAARTAVNGTQLAPGQMCHL
jgi:hypothetical protein